MLSREPIQPCTECSRSFSHGQRYFFTDRETWCPRCYVNSGMSWEPDAEEAFRPPLCNEDCFSGDGKDECFNTRMRTIEKEEFEGSFAGEPMKLNTLVMTPKEELK